MANDRVLVEGNTIVDNPTSGVMVVAYPMKFDDKTYNPYPRNVVIGENTVDRGGTDPQIDGRNALLAAFGGALPPVMWDGLAQEGTVALRVDPSLGGWSLNLPAQAMAIEVSLRRGAQRVAVVALDGGVDLTDPLRQLATDLVDRGEPDADLRLDVLRGLLDLGL